MVKGKRFVLVKKYDGEPKESDVKIVEEELPPIKDNEFLSEALYISVDPYQRAYPFPVGSTLIGSQVAKVLESKNPKYPVGKYILGEFGWRSHYVGDGSPETLGFGAAWVIPDLQGFPLSLALGVLGMPGNTAYFGVLDILKPKDGDTLVVSGGAGAVGSLVGQMGKIKGCKVIGITSTEEKGKWLVDELKFDGYLNYKKPDFLEDLKASTPNGVDLYFDNVGGEISSQIIQRMNVDGKIAVCGSISSYNDNSLPKATIIQPVMIMKQLTMKGLHVIRYLDRFLEGILQNKQWVIEGKLKYEETITEGFENTFKAFTDMLKGKNKGKAIVKVQ